VERKRRLERRENKVEKVTKGVFRRKVKREIGIGAGKRKRDTESMDRLNEKELLRIALFVSQRYIKLRDGGDDEK